MRNDIHESIALYNSILTTPNPTNEQCRKIVTHVESDIFEVHDQIEKLRAVQDKASRILDGRKKLGLEV